MTRTVVKWSIICYAAWWVYKRLPSMPPPLTGDANIFGDEEMDNESPWGEGF